jgi:hypothetical protein
MNLIDALFRWLFGLPPLQAMQVGARSVLEFTLLALIDSETMKPRSLEDDYLRSLHAGVSMAAALIDIVVGARAASLAGIPENKRHRGLPELPRKRCGQAAMIRRVGDLLHRLDHLEAAAARLARRMMAVRTETQRIGRIAGVPTDAPLAPAATPFIARACARRRALEFSG